MDRWLTTSEHTPLLMIFAIFGGFSQARGRKQKDAEQVSCRCSLDWMFRAIESICYKCNMQ
jgi:hypothetical protein